MNERTETVMRYPAQTTKAAVTSTTVLAVALWSIVVIVLTIVIR